MAVYFEVEISGRWEEAAKEANQRSKAKVTGGDRVSIFPLELITVALLLCLAMETPGAI